MEDIRTRALASPYATEALEKIKAAQKALRVPHIENISRVIDRQCDDRKIHQIRQTITALEFAGLVDIREARGNFAAEVRLTDAGWQHMGGKPLGLQLMGA